MEYCIHYKLVGKIETTEPEVAQKLEENRIWQQLQPVEIPIQESKIQRGILQRDALSPLLFIIAMVPFNHILRYKLCK